MFYEHEYNEIKSAFDQAQNKKRKSFIIFLLIFEILTMAVMIFSYIKLKQDQGFEDFIPETVYISVSIFSLLFLSWLIFVFSKRIYERPFIEIVYKHLIEHINRDFGLNYEFTSYEKNNKAQIENFLQSGLFSRSSIFVKFHIKGYTDNQYPFDLYNVRFVQSNGQSTTVPFDGIYSSIKTADQTTLQIRTKGKPYVKGVKFNKVEEKNYYTVFKPKDQMLNDVDKKYMELFKNLFNQNTMKDMYISVVDQKVVLAIKYHEDPFKKPKAFNLDILNQISDKLLKEINQLNIFD